ncbi:hypothetical protein [Myxococcus sp. CA039A]|uniref:hypothetical protein n=1 Tax=Myxococcus sp. CA039A TaxID=2741737 RepID=UPI00157A2DD5|nr:hypothetical protein [Myxococcus sp. CA039A]NTX50053.1 hypothetical protein [Myxococcus sp. CA039A]
MDLTHYCVLCKRNVVDFRGDPCEPCKRNLCISCHSFRRESEDGLCMGCGKKSNSSRVELSQGGPQSNLLIFGQAPSRCSNCKGPVSFDDGWCPDCGFKLHQPKPKNTRQGPGTLSLELVLSLIDRWINTYDFWKGYELQSFELTKKYLESNSCDLVVVVDCLLKTLARPIPFSNKQGELDIFHQALRKVTLLAQTQGLLSVNPNDFDLLFRRIFLDRLHTLKYLLHLHERGESPSSSSTTQSISLMGKWRVEQRKVWTNTIQEKIYQEYIHKHGKAYTLAMERLKQQHVLAVSCGSLPATLIELSECNLCFVIQELNTKLPPKEGACVTKEKFYQLLYSGEIYAESGYSAWKIDPIEVKKTYTRLSEEEDTREIVLTCAEWMLYEHFIKLPMYFKHGTETEAIKSSHSLMSPTVGNQSAKYTSKTMDAKFGHIDYVFGRLEFTYNAMTGGSRYGDIVLCMNFDEIGPELCISLHDQGIPFDNENTHKSVLYDELVRVIDFKEKHCSEWTQVYGKTKHYNCFLFEVFYGNWGCRAALALSLIRELRRYQGKVDLLGMLIKDLSVASATLESPEDASVLTLLHKTLKTFFRTEIRVPCILSLEEPTIVTIFDQTVDTNSQERIAQSKWAKARALPYVDYGPVMSVERLTFCILRISQINLEDAGFDFAKHVQPKFNLLEELCARAAKGENVPLRDVQDYFKPYKGKLDKLDSKKKVKKTKKQTFIMNCDTLCGVIHRMLQTMAEIANTGHSNLLAPPELRSKFSFQ